MDTYLLNAKTRQEKGKAVKRIRREGLVPAVVYGQNSDPMLISIDVLEFERVYNQAGESAIIELKVDETNAVNVLIKDVDRQPVNEGPLHIDFIKLNMKEEIETEIPIEIEGESPSVKNFGGVLVTNMNHLEVKCLPGDLISNFTVNIDNLLEFGDSINVKDMDIPEGIEVLNDPETTVVTVTAPRAEEEVKPAEEEVAPGEVPTTEQGDAEEGEEGESEGDSKDGGDEEKKD